MLPGERKSFLPKSKQEGEVDVNPEAEHWVAVDGAYWRTPEGPGSTYKFHENHPVVHVSHRDAAQYCEWVRKRIPGEWEWEAVARAGHYGPKNRTLYSWGDDDSVEMADLAIWNAYNSSALMPQEPDYNLLRLLSLSGLSGDEAAIISSATMSQRGTVLQPPFSMLSSQIISSNLAPA